MKKSIIAVMLAISCITGCSSKEESKTAISENTKKAIGDCFAEGRLEEFISKDGDMYLAEAVNENISISVKDMKLEEKGDLTENVKVTLEKEDKEEQVSVHVTKESDGKIKKIQIIE